MFRLFLTISAAVLIATCSCGASAQTPAPNPPEAAPAPAQPAPAPAQPAPAQPAPATPADPFGAEVTVEPKTFIYMKGTATWETAYETLIGAFKTINGYLEKQKINHLFVSLYGLKTTEQIDDEFWRQLHPVLSSKPMKLLGAVANPGFKRGLIGDVKRGADRVDFLGLQRRHGLGDAR